jgi:predicted phosphodiesterase
MRILHISDFHLQWRWLNWLEKAASEVDCVCFSGDLFDVRLDQEKNAYQRLSNWLATVEYPFIACCGNHDYFQGALGYRVPDKRNITFNTRVDYGDVTFLAIHGSPGDATSYRALLEDRKKRVILVHHYSPVGCLTGDSWDGIDLGSPILTDVVRNYLVPGDVVLAGHVHRPIHWHSVTHSVSCFNAGHLRNATIPNHIRLEVNLRHLAASHYPTGGRFGRSV